LKNQGIEDITILDSKIICLEDASISHIAWETYLDSLWDYDIIIKTPGISPFHEKILPYKDKIISQAHIFFAEYSGKVIWITGTKGKSTLSTLLYTCLEHVWYNVKLAWNIGNPILDEIDISEEYDYIVYELSSYMLQDFIPHLNIWVLNNIYPCHLDWHYDSFTIYKEAKLNILKDASIKIVNTELREDASLRSAWEGKLFFNAGSSYNYDERGFLIDSEHVYVGSLLLVWEHNKKNICAIIAVLDSILWDINTLKDVLQNVLPWFSGLPHRIEKNIISVRRR